MRPVILVRLHRLAAAALVTLLSSGASAQSPGLDLNILALDWARGNYGSPLLCEVEGEAVRAIRRVLIAPDTGSERGPTDRIQFPDPEARGASRCFSELGSAEPLVSGTLFVSLPGRSRPDTARYDFESALKRAGGFVFDVREGKLTVRGWEPGRDAATVDFKGGVARLHQVKPGSDAERLLRGFSAPRKLELVLEAQDGTTLRFYLFQIAGR